MEKKHYLDHRKRLKERFMKAPHAVNDAEVVELLLGYVIRGKDVKPQSKELLAEAARLNNIFSVDMKKVKGTGPETSIFFAILQEFYARCGYQKAADEPIDMHNTSLVFDFLKHKIGHSKKENFIIILMDTKSRLKSYKIVREGFTSSVAMSARDIIEEAILNNAVSVIIAHNHPSGDVTPSNADLKITRQISHALKYTGVVLLDHLIVTPNDFHSMKAHNQLGDEFKID